MDPWGLNKTPAKDCCKEKENECKKLYKKIANKSVGYKKDVGNRGLKERIEELKEDKYDLYNRARYVNPHQYGLLKGKGTWVGHIQQAENLKSGLQKNIIEYETKGCNGIHKKLPYEFVRVSKLSIPARSGN